MLAGALLAVLGFGLGFGAHDANLQVTTQGPSSDAHLDARAADRLVFRARADLPALMESATLEFDGTDVLDDATLGDGDLEYRPPPDLAEGPHTLQLTVDQLLVPWPVTRTWRFRVDRTRPRIAVDPAAAARLDQPATISGRVSEPARVTADGAAVQMEDRRFTLTLPTPPNRPIALRATDRAGNARGVAAIVPVEPRTPPQPTRAVHMTAISWATPGLRRPVLRMIERGLINTVQLDLKDESGIVGYDSRLPFARRIGAVQPSYRLRAAVADLHGRGVRVVGRIVAFRDPVHAAFAWSRGDRAQVIQTPEGGPYAGYGGFTNFADPAVRRYNIDIAREAARAGVDDIVYDYVRRPDGPLESMRFPGLRGGAQASVASFLGEARAALRPTGTFLGASLFGVAATRPQEIAQNVTKIARNVDYVAPLLYPSGWGPGEYGVADPAGQPAAIVRASLADFQDRVAGTGARLVPWLQDFTLGPPYGPDQVRAQIEASRSLGVNEFILWNAGVRYQPAGIPR